MQCFMYVRHSPFDNHYAHPLDMVVNLELYSRKVLMHLAAYGSLLLHLVVMHAMSRLEWMHLESGHKTRLSVPPPSS